MRRGVAVNQPAQSFRHQFDKPSKLAGVEELITKDEKNDFKSHSMKNSQSIRQSKLQDADPYDDDKVPMAFNKVAPQDGDTTPRAKELRGFNTQNRMSSTKLLEDEWA